MSYQAKLIKGGKVVIPAMLRRELGFKDGDRLVFERVGNSAVLKTYDQVVREVQANIKQMIGPNTHSIVDELIAERRAEAALEDKGA